MGDILSKEEIEVLLSAVSQGRIPEKEKKKGLSYKKAAISYNFKRPALVSKEQVKVLELLHEDFTRSYGVKLSNYLRTTVELEIIAVDQLIYTEFIASLSEPTYLVVFDVEPLSGQIVLEVNPFLIFSIVDRLLGGSGKNFQEPRELTPIEHSIMNKVITLTKLALQEAWKHIIPFQLTIQAKESNPQFVQIVPGGELVIIIIFKVNMGESSGIMNVCYPVSALKPILSKLNPQRWISEREERSGEKNFKQIQRSLSDIQLEVSVELGRAKISVLDFLRLAPGDVICLSQPVDKDLVVKVQDLPKFYALPGRVGRRKAVQITSLIEQEGKDGR